MWYHQPWCLNWTLNRHQTASTGDRKNLLLSYRTWWKCEEWGKKRYVPNFLSWTLILCTVVKTSYNYFFTQYFFFILIKIIYLFLFRLAVHLISKNNNPSFLRSADPLIIRGVILTKFWPMRSKQNYRE